MACFLGRTKGRYSAYPYGYYISDSACFLGGTGECCIVCRRGRVDMSKSVAVGNHGEEDNMYRLQERRCYGTKGWVGYPI